MIINKKSVCLILLILFHSFVMGDIIYRGISILQKESIASPQDSFANSYGVEQALKISGVSYILTNEVNDAVQYSMIIISNPLTPQMFSNEEILKLYDYVNNGGILLATKISDPSFNVLFGIKGFQTSRLRKSMSWNIDSENEVFVWFDDPLEQEIRFASLESTTSLETVSYILNNAEPLANYDDNSTGATFHRYSKGYAYNLGFSFKDVISRNLLNRDLGASRAYSNSFEPATDVFILLFRAIYTKHIPYGCWKKTSPGLSRATVIITHDVDSNSGMKMINEFAEMENNRGISTTYNITTTYIRDQRVEGGWGGFYNEENILLLKEIIKKNQKIGSHTVGHFKDFGDETNVPQGNPGNTVETYRPYFENGRSIGATVYGECEVSKNLLEQDLGVNVKSFRTGHLVFNDKQPEILEELGYLYDSSASANGNLIDFPYYLQVGRAYDGKVSNIIEIPLSISDVVDEFSSSNYQEIVDMWLNITLKNVNNSAPTNLLIHPNRDYKILAEESYIDQLPADVTFMDIDSFGNFWRKRDSFIFTTTASDGTLIIKISENSFPFDGLQSLIISGGENLTSIIVQKEDGSQIPFFKTKWRGNDSLIHWGLVLTAKRGEERSWSIIKNICRIEINLEIFNIQSDYKVILYRSIKGGTFSHLTDVANNDIKDGKFIYYDKHIEKGTSYSYKAIVYDNNNNQIMVSNEQTI